ncbi:hypothetical protein DENSPDRAFT_406889 [Dentipellis sp. KUC8613]|nr:hypothetical protein DENSPDRAFT_406889 [Dentipellis sp. KUC8613]
MAAADVTGVTAADVMTTAGWHVVHVGWRTRAHMRPVVRGVRPPNGARSGCGTRRQCGRAWWQRERVLTSCKTAPPGTMQRHRGGGRRAARRKASSGAARV